MEFKKFDFSPKDGFLDSAYYEDTPGNPREILQRQHNQTRDFINSIVDTLNCKEAGESGLETIKAPEIEGVAGDNAHTQIKDIKRQLDNVALKEIPDGSVGENKLKNDSISKDKIKDEAVTTSKFSSDAIAPCAQEARSLNGVSADKYLPSDKSSVIGTYKECFSKVRSNFFSNGKNIGNKRYITVDNTIYSLNLLNGEETVEAEITDVSFADFFIDSDENIYILESKYQSGKYTLMVYQYSREYKICVLVKELSVNSIEDKDFQLYKVAFDGDYVYFIMALREVNWSEYYLYDFKLDELGNTDEVFSVAYERYNEKKGVTLKTNNNITVFADTIIYNRDYQNGIKIDFTVDEIDSGNIYSENSNVMIRDGYDLSPKVIICNALKSMTGFLWHEYLYVYIEDYLVRTKIL